MVKVYLTDDDIVAFNDLVSMYGLLIREVPPPSQGPDMLRAVHERARKVQNKIIVAEMEEP